MRSVSLRSSGCDVEPDDRVDNRNDLRQLKDGVTLVSFAYTLGIPRSFGLRRVDCSERVGANRFRAVEPD